MWDEKKGEVVGEMKRSSRILRREEGQATVEFAIVVPLLLLLVVGILQFGKAFNYWIDLNHLSNEGARWASVDKVPPYGANPGQTLDDCTKLKSYLLSQMNTGDLQTKVGASNITVKVLGTGPSGAPQIGDPVTVSIKAPDYAIASLGFDLGSITLGGQSTMRLEQLPSWTNNSNPC